MQIDLLREVRQALGAEEHETHKDAYIASLSPDAKLRLLCQWNLGDSDWASVFINWARECGFEVKG